MFLARLGLRLNGLLSLVTGLLLVVAAPTVGDWLGVSVDGLLRLFGAALIGHAGFLAWAPGRENVRPWVLANLVMIAPYPLLILGLVLSGTISRSLGQGLALVDGLLVGALAVMQFLGLRDAELPAHPHPV